MTEFSHDEILDAKLEARIEAQEQAEDDQEDLSCEALAEQEEFRDYLRDDDCADYGTGFE
jgi:hypothetical protein